MSFLLGKSTVDKGLDKLFANAKPADRPKPSVRPKPSTSDVSFSIQENKLKRPAATESDTSPSSKKRAKKAPALEEQPMEQVEAPKRDEDSYQPPVHESLTKKKHTKSSAKPKYVPADETPSQRDSRTLFITNVALGIVNSKPVVKQLKSHVLATLNGKKAVIESLRIRSIPFSTPTSTAGKKKAAAIKGEVHGEGKGCNVYVVFGFDGQPIEDGNEQAVSDGKSKAVEVLDPYEAAQLAAEASNGTMFLDRRIRVAVASGNVGAVIGKADAQPFNPRQTLFLGSLDFNVDEEGIRALFEKLVKEVEAEKSDEEDSGSDSDEEEEEEEEEKAGGSSSTPGQSVKNVRLIRDRETQVGKGIGYVELDSSHSLDLLLSLHRTTPAKFKIGGRKMRVEKCKKSDGTARQATANSTHPRSGPATASTSRAQPQVPILTEEEKEARARRLGRLPKAERIKDKKADQDRAQRRVEKKRKKVEARTSKGKADVLGRKAGGDKPKTRDRKRVRKEGAKK